MNRSFTVNRQGETINFESSLQDSEVIEVLSSMPAQKKDGSESFAGSLVAQVTTGRMYRGRMMKPKAWSETQRAWAHKIALDELQRQSSRMAPQPAAPTVEADALVAMLQNASAALKYPKVIVWTEHGRGFRLSIAGARARFPGSLTVTSAEKNDWSERQWYGRIMTDGTVDLKASSPEWLLPAIQRFAADPETVAKESAEIAGACSFCNRELTDERSTEKGYGPVCAKRYGLAW